jgi:hypothetical protein
MKKTTCIFGALILAGCASSGHIADLPTITDGTAASTLVLIRGSSLIGMPNTYFVALDGKDVFGIRSGENTRFLIPAGQHTVTVKCFGGWSPTWKEDGKGFVAEKNQASYFSISPDLRCANIKQVSETEGKSLLGKTNFIDPTVASNK